MYGMIVSDGKNEEGSRIPLVRTSSKSAARPQPRRTAGGGPPRERRVPPAGALAEVIREKGPTYVQSPRERKPPHQRRPSLLGDDCHSRTSWRLNRRTRPSHFCSVDREDRVLRRRLLLN
ncbi:unnamed protein product [Pleuronectes platessa]|uniref:Uncharacterized protein n=1 Tax=Pleuronectes platessa TaxID=8262 RepID=A0A9N7UYU1_PLEPL|nr:unnamed protein product [Pleuronectes platessa]